MIRPVKLHQPPTALAAMTALGVCGLVQAIWPLDDTIRVVGLFQVGLAVTFWIWALVYEPGPNAWRPSLPTRIALAVGSVVVGLTLSLVIR